MSLPIEAIEQHIVLGANYIRPDTHIRPPGVGVVRSEDMSAYQEIMTGPPQELHLNLIMIPPDEADTQLPLRYALYVAEALEFAEALQAKGHKLTHFRVAIPIHISSAVNHVDKTAQQENAQTTLVALIWLKNTYWPQLEEVDFVPDWGKPFDPADPDILQTGRETAAALGKKLQPFLQMASRHNGYYEEPDQEATGVYVWAHAPMWQQKVDERFTDQIPNGQAINFAPRSEAPFLQALADLGILDGDQPRAINVLASATTQAPYYPLSGAGYSEPLLTFKMPEVECEAEDPKTNLETNQIQLAMNQLRRGSGHHQVAYIIKCLGILRTILQRRE